VQLRVPGEAACLRLDDAHQPLSHHTCNDALASQRWRFDPVLAAFRAAKDPSLCLDYSAEDQAFAVWPCAEEEQAQKAQREGERGFVYRRFQSKYCLRRGHTSTCVQEAATGSSILLRRPMQPGTCLRYLGRERRVQAVACSRSDETQQWILHTPTSTFRPALDATLCLDLFAADVAEFGRSSRVSRPSVEEAAEEAALTIDNGGALGVWRCQSHASNERFVYDRYMGRYCVASWPSVCVLEASIGTPLRLRHPGELACLHFDGGLATLAQRPCNASEIAQQWLYDEASLVFRHASNAQRCIDFFVAHEAFGAWSCRDHQK